MWLWFGKDILGHVAMIKLDKYCKDGIWSSERHHEKLYFHERNIALYQQEVPKWKLGHSLAFPDAGNSKKDHIRYREGLWKYGKFLADSQTCCSSETGQILGK